MIMIFMSSCWIDLLLWNIPLSVLTPFVLMTMLFCHNNIWYYSNSKLMSFISLPLCSYFFFKPLSIFIIAVLQLFPANSIIFVILDVLLLTDFSSGYQSLFLFLCTSIKFSLDQWTLQILCFEHLNFTYSFKSYWYLFSQTVKLGMFVLLEAFC